jgi:hypothetical protein
MSDVSGRGLVVTALLKEYENIHRRVLDQVQLYETTNTKILALLGVLFYFGISEFNDTVDGFILFVVNVVFLVVVPAISFASVLFAGANVAKVMIWGDFLKMVENKVNKVLGEEAQSYGFTGGRVLCWEHWRVNCGYAGKQNAWSMVTFSGLLVIAFLLSSLVSVAMRLLFIYERYPSHFDLWVGAEVLMALVFALVMSRYAVLFKEKRAESMKVADNDATI